MPFRNGSLSVRRYVVADPVPDTLPRAATMAIRRWQYRPIDSARGERESFGWVNPRRPLQETFTWEELVDGPLVFLAARRDRKAVSPVLFRAHREELFRRVKEERGLARLTRQHRLALESQLMNEMLAATSPSVAIVELVWDMNSNDVFIGSTSKAVCERIADLFLTTFDLRLTPRFPALAGYAFMAEQGLEDAFAAAGAAADEMTPNRTEYKPEDDDSGAAPPWE